VGGEKNGPPQNAWEKEERVQDLPLGFQDGTGQSIGHFLRVFAKDQDAEKK